MECKHILQAWKNTSNKRLFSIAVGLRLLFTREFSMPDALTLWDCLFACDANLELTQWVCVAMLIRIRNDCMPSRSLK